MKICAARLKYNEFMTVGAYLLFCPRLGFEASFVCFGIIFLFDFLLLFYNRCLYYTLTYTFQMSHIKP